MTAGDSQTVSVTATGGKGDTIKFASSNKAVLTVDKASAKANKKTGIAKMDVKAVKEGTATLTVSSKNTGVKKAFKITVKAAAPAPTQAPQVATTPAVTTATATPVTTPAVQATATAGTNTTLAPGQTEVPGTDATLAPGQTEVPGTDATLAPGQTEVPGTDATLAPGQTIDPNATQAPTPTDAPQVPSGSAVSATAISVVAYDTEENELALTSVTKNGTIKVTFDKELSSEAVGIATFTLKDANGKNISMAASDVKLSTDKKTVTVSLTNANLTKGATYTLNVSDAVANPSSTSFTVSGKSIIKSIKLDGKTAADELDTNMNTTGLGTNTGDFAGGYLGKRIVVVYDELLDASTVNAANVVLTNTTTGERVAVTYDVDNTTGTIKIDTNTTLISNNMYKLTINNVKTAVNGETESVEHVFTVNGDTPLSGSTRSMRTVDNSVSSLPGQFFNSSSYLVWPRTTAGSKETSLTTSKYYAGLSIIINVAESLDAASVEKNVVLVEKETQTAVSASIVYDSVSRTITVTPTANLKEATDYEIQFYGGLKTTENVYLKADKKSEVDTTKTATFRTLDVTAPELVSLVANSGNGAIEAGKEQKFTATFSEPVGLTKNNVMVALSTVDPQTQGTSVGVVASSKITVVPVAGTDEKQWTIKLDDTALVPDKAYKLYIVGKDMKDYEIYTTAELRLAIVNDGAAAGVNHMTTSTVLAFSTVVDTVAPKVEAVYDGDKVDANKLISTTKTNIKAGSKMTFLFDEKLNGTASDSVAVRLEQNVNGSWVNPIDPSNPGSGTPASASAQLITVEGEVKAVTVTFAGNFDDAKYRVVFGKNAVTDVATPDQNGMEEYKYSFVGTYGDDEAASVAITPIKLDGASYTNSSATVGAKDSINTEAAFAFELDEKNIVSLTTDNVVVTDAAGNAVAGTVKEITATSAYTQYDSTKATYVFVPSAKLAADTTYVVTLKDVKDVVGNTVATKTQSFKTAADKKVSSISITDGASNVNRTPVITVKLTSGVDLTKSSDVIIKEVGGSEFTDYTLKASDDKKTYTITVKDATPLNPNTTYKLTVKDAVDEDVEITFTTGLEAKDVIAPTIKAVEVNGVAMTNGATEQVDLSPANDTIVIRASENVKTENVTATITDVADNTKTATVLSKSGDGTNTLTLTTSGMEKDKTYKVVISGVKDDAGNKADDFTFYVTDDTTSGSNAVAAKVKLLNASLAASNTTNVTATELDVIVGGSGNYNSTSNLAAYQTNLADAYTTKGSALSVTEIIAVIDKTDLNAEATAIGGTPAMTVGANKTVTIADGNISGKYSGTVSTVVTAIDPTAGITIADVANSSDVVLTLTKGSQSLAITITVTGDGGNGVTTAATHTAFTF